jgi:hypothetical protein
MTENAADTAPAYATVRAAMLFMWNPGTSPVRKPTDAPAHEAHATASRSPDIAWAKRPERFPVGVTGRLPRRPNGML